MALLGMQHCAPYLGSLSRTLQAEGGFCSQKEPQLAQITSNVLIPPGTKRLWHPGCALQLLSLSNHFVLLLKSSQFYPEMKEHHLCQESHAETWFCFVSGHTVFDKIRRKLSYQHSHRRRRGFSASYKMPSKEDIRKHFLQVPNPTLWHWSGTRNGGAGCQVLLSTINTAWKLGHKGQWSLPGPRVSQ